MHRLALSVGLAAMTLAGTASAQNDAGQYNNDYGQQAYAQSDGCKSTRNEQKLVGGLIGGALGALAGAAIGNNLGDGNSHYRGRGYGGYGNSHGYGYNDPYYSAGYGNGYNGHPGYDRHRRRSGNDDTEQIVGALILGGLGAYAGSQIASSQVDCKTQVYHGIPAPTRQAYGAAWEQSPSPYQQTGARSDELYGGQYGRRSSSTTQGQDQNQRGADTRECEPVYRETRLPDGQVIREEVQACRDGVTYFEPRTAYGEWGVDKN